MLVKVLETLRKPSQLSLPTTATKLNQCCYDLLSDPVSLKTANGKLMDIKYVSSFFQNATFYDVHPIELRRPHKKPPL